MSANIEDDAGQEFAGMLAVGLTKRPHLVVEMYYPRLRFQILDSCAGCPSPIAPGVTGSRAAGCDFSLA